MALWFCAGCSTAYAVGLPACPHCQSADHHEEGTMPKITLHGGPSNAAEAELQAADDTPEEEPSPGNSSAASSPKLQPTSEKSSSARRSRARTTENPSSPGQTESSTAAGTDGDPADGTSAADTK